MKKIYLINTENWPTPGTHHLGISKFIRGFRYYDYDIDEIKSESQLNSVSDNIGDIMIFSNHGLRNDYIEKLQPFSKFKNITFILWYFHDVVHNIPLNKWLLTGEYFRKEPEMVYHNKCYHMQKNMNNYVPLVFGANNTPEQIESFIKPEVCKYKANFVGFRYKPDWLSQLNTSDYFIRHYPPYISEADRIDSFINSYCSLGFHSNENISHGVIVERVWEALSYKCIVLSDNPVVVEATNGIVEYVDNYNDLLNKIEFYSNNKCARDKKIEETIILMKSQGCYCHSAKLFLDKMVELKYVES